MAAFSPEFLNRLSELGNEYQRLSEKHEQLEHQEQQLQQQKQKLQAEVQQLQEGRVLLVTENRSLIEKLQEVTDEKQQLHEELEELKETKKAISLQLAERDEQITELQQQLHAQNAAHEKEILKYTEKREQLQQENDDLQEKVKVLNKKRQDLADQVRLASEEQQRRLEEISSLAAEKQQLVGWKKQQIEESRLLSGRVRTLTLKQKQLQDEKQQVVNNLKKQQEEQQLKWERRLRNLEQLRDETLEQLKNVEEEKEREIEEHAREAAEKQQWQSKAVALEEQLQAITFELHRVEDALNTEKNIVEENKQRHQLDMQDYIHRAMEQQNNLKHNFAADYKKACDEIERGNRERHQLVEAILEFARAHGCSYYASQQTKDSNSSNSNTRRSSITTPTARPTPRQKNDNALDASSVLSNANSDVASARVSASVLDATTTTAAGSSRGVDLMYINPVEASAAAEQSQHWRMQQQQRKTSDMVESEEKAFIDADSPNSAMLSSSNSSSPSAVAPTLRLIGARMAALEAAAQAANQQHKRAVEERDALQKAFLDISEKARAATDAKQQLALRFCAVIYGIRELSEKAAFEQQLVKPLLAPFRASSCADGNSSHIFAYSSLNTSSDQEAGNVPLSSVETRGTSARAEKSFTDDRAHAIGSGTLAEQRVDSLRERVNTTLHEEASFSIRGVESRDKAERYEKSGSRASPEYRQNITKTQASEALPAQNISCVAAHVAVSNCGEHDENDFERKILCNTQLCGDERANLKPHGTVVSFPENADAGAEAKDTRNLSPFSFPQSIRYSNSGDDAELPSLPHPPAYTVYRSQRDKNCTEKKPFYPAENNRFSSTPRTAPAAGSTQRALNSAFSVNQHVVDERSKSCHDFTGDTLLFAMEPSPQDLNYVCGGWDKRNKLNEGREEEETTDSSSRPSLCDQHFSSNENAFGPFDLCAGSREGGVNIADNAD